MNAAETIAAAIDRLEQLRGLQGSWTLQGGSEYIHPIGVTIAPDDGGVTSRQAELIVTLHRTIDAQLAILEDASRAYAGIGSLPPGGAHLIGGIYTYHVDLARAILGEVS